MRRVPAAWLAVLGALVGCSDTSWDDADFPDADRAVAVRLEVDEVEVGAQFTVTVDRVQPADEAAIEFDADWLAPLVLGRPVRAERTAGGRRQERLVFPAYATGPGELSLPREVTVGEDPSLQSLVVRSVLPDGDDGTLEPAPLPGGDDAPLWPWIAGAVVVAGAGLALRRRRRTSPPEPVAEPEVVVATARPEEVLARALDDLDPTSDAFHAELAAALRAYVGGVAGTAHLTATDQQLLAALAATDVSRRSQSGTLEGLLGECETVRFGGARMPRPAADAALSRARSLLSAAEAAR